MRRIFYYIFRRKLDPRTFITGVCVVSAVLFFLLVGITLFKTKKERPPLVVYPPERGMEIDRGELSVMDTLEYPIRGSEGEILLGLGDLSAFALSPDWKRLATGSVLGVFVWDISGKDPMPLKWFRNENDVPSSLAFSPDGRRLAQGNAKGSLTLWELESGESLFHIRANIGAAILQLAFSPDGKQMATGDSSGCVMIWDVAAGSQMGKFRYTSSAISGLSFSPDGRYILVTSDLSSTMTVWDLAKEALILPRQYQSLVSPETFILPRQYQNIVFPKTFDVKTPSAMFSPDGKRILSRCSSQATQPIVVWDVNLFENGSEIKGETHLLRSATDTDGLIQFQNAVFSPDGQMILTAWERIDIWDAHTGAPIRSIQEERGAISYLACSPDGQRIFTYHPQANLFQFRALETGEVIRSFYLHSKNSPYIYFMPDNQRVMTGTQYGETIFWDIESGRITGHSFLSTKNRQLTVNYSSDRKWLLTQSYDKQYRIYNKVGNVWNVETGENVCSLDGITPRLYYGVFSKDGSKLICSAGRGEVTIWDLETGRNTTSNHDQLTDWSSGKINTENPNQDMQEIIRSSITDFAAIITIGSETIHFWDTHTGKFVRSIKLDRPVNEMFPRINLSPDGKSIISFYDDRNTLDFIDIESGTTREIQIEMTEIRNMIGALLRPRHSGINSDQKILVEVMYGSNRRVIAWDLEKYRKIGEFPHNVSNVSSYDLSPDGKLLLIGGNDGTIRIWNLSDHLILSSTDTIHQ